MAPLEFPRGIYQARLDDKGRLKLPTAFQEYLNALPEKKLFVTSLDERTARLYPIAAWRQNELFFDAYKKEPKKAKHVWFKANKLGADSEMDGQGRVLFPPELRRTLKIENQPVKLYAYKGHLEVLSEAVFAELDQESSQDPVGELETLEAEGLQ